MRKAMGRMLALVAAAMFLLVLAACAGTQMTSDQQLAVEKIAARTTGYLVGKNNPALVGQVVPYLDVYLQAESLQDAVIRQGIAVLVEEVEDPIIEANIMDVVQLVQTRPPPGSEELESAFDEMKLRVAMEGFREGLILGRDLAPGST